eukprot:g308.t1
MKNEKRLLRSVMRVLHPDLYTSHPAERDANSEALKRLNVYLDNLADGVRLTPISLEFWIKKNGVFEQVKTELHENGNLSPLYFALGLITDEEYANWTESSKFINSLLLWIPSGGTGTVIDEDLVDWLRALVAQVVQDGEQHTFLNNRISALKAKVEDQFHLQNITMGTEFGITVSDLRLQLRLLEYTNEAFGHMEEEDLFSGLSLCIHHPDCLPLDPFDTNRSFHELQQPALESSFCWISDDGCIHLFIKCDELSKALSEVDINRSRLLTRLHQFWEQRASDLQNLMQKLFQVDAVLCDNSSAANVQQFVLWAGCIMANREQIQRRLTNQALPLTLLIHSDKTAPMIDYSIASSTLHIRTDCTPLYLLNFVTSEECLNAGNEAQEMISEEAEEQRILEEARVALGAKHVIRICSVYERQKAIRAAERLIKNAEVIRQTVDLSEAGIAIDSNYQAWDSGFISIPYDYHLKELKPNLQKLIGTGKRVSRRQQRTTNTVGKEQKDPKPKFRSTTVSLMRLQQQQQNPNPISLSHKRHDLKRNSKLSFNHWNSTFSSRYPSISQIRFPKFI